MGLRADTEGDGVAEQRSDPSGDPRLSSRLQKPRLPSSGRPPADPSPSLVPTAARSHQRRGAGANAPGRASCTSARARAIGSPQPQPSRPTLPPRRSPAPACYPGVAAASPSPPRGCPARGRNPAAHSSQAPRIYQALAVGAVLSRAGA